MRLLQRSLGIPSHLENTQTLDGSLEGIRIQHVWSFGFAERIYHLDDAGCRESIYCDLSMKLYIPLAVKATCLSTVSIAGLGRPMQMETKSVSVLSEYRLSLLQFSLLVSYA